MYFAFEPFAWMNVVIGSAEEELPILKRGPAERVEVLLMVKLCSPSDV
jgi:hypothetical protein